MSPRLAISAAISVLAMAAFALSATDPAPEPFGTRSAAPATIRAAMPAPAPSLRGLAPSLLR